MTKPNSLPYKWGWTTIGDIVKFEYGKGLTKGTREEKGNIPVYGSNGKVGVHSKALVNEPCIIIGRKGTAGAVHLVNGPCWPIDTTYYVIPPQNLNLKFLYYLFKSLDFNSLDRSTAIPGLNRHDAYALEIPLPPLTEQEIIVSKFEALFSQLDEGVAGLKRVQELLKQYRASVLKAAFEGRLVPQDPNDEPIETLLERISSYKDNWNNLRQRKLITKEIQPDDVPYMIPNTWRWVRLCDICSVVTDINHKMPKEKAEGIVFISAKDLVENGQINFTENVKKISVEDFRLLSKRVIPQKDDIIFSRIGTIGKSRIVKTDERFMVSYSLCVIRPIEIINEYLNYFLDSGIVLAQAKNDTQSIGVPDLGIQSIRNFLVALPPLGEQKRIVEKIDEFDSLYISLSGVVDKLLLYAQKIRQSILNAAFQGKLTTKEGN